MPKAVGRVSLGDDEGQKGVSLPGFREGQEYGEDQNFEGHVEQ